MKWHFNQLRVVGLVVIFSASLTVMLFPALSANAQEAKKLRIDQLKINAEDQFVTIYNSSDDIAELSEYELIYLNADNKPTKTFTFGGELSPESYLVLNDGRLNVCNLMQVESVSLSFSTTGGSVQLWHYQGEFTKTLDSVVSWVKTKKSSTPISTLQLPVDAANFLNRNLDKPNEWQIVSPDPDNSCLLQTIVENGSEVEEPSVIYSFLPSSLPNVKFVGEVNSSKTTINRNVGKMAPVVNELLPNPASPQKDANDEFIEIYNPNNSSFDLTDFQLAFGSSNPRKYTFPEGTILPSHGFVAFTSANTSISLSNSVAQVWLLDPGGAVISESDPYESAKDGQSWALNNGVWQWTSAPSPNEENTLTTTRSGGGEQNQTATVLGISSTNSTPGATVASITSSPENLGDQTPMHPLVLAGVGLLAVGYAIYEYRGDISNRFFQFKRYLRTRRSLR